MEILCHVLRSLYNAQKKKPLFQTSFRPVGIDTYNRYKKNGDTKKTISREVAYSSVQSRFIIGENHHSY
ncbi:hypothetical protein Mapa_002103 [Marchantia paleacea]|nr:hypothetical protein Mapa_002103 [Marchantia paleacea]